MMTSESVGIYFNLVLVYSTCLLRTCRVFIAHCGIWAVVLYPVHRVVVFIAHYGIWVVLSPVHCVFIAHFGIPSTPRLG